MVDAMQGL